MYDNDFGLHKLVFLKKKGRKKRVSKDIILITFQTCFFKNKNDRYKKRK